MGLFGKKKTNEEILEEGIALYEAGEMEKAYLKLWKLSLNFRAGDACYGAKYYVARIMLEDLKRTDKDLPLDMLKSAADNGYPGAAQYLKKYLGGTDGTKEAQREETVDAEVTADEKEENVRLTEEQRKVGAVLRAVEERRREECKIAKEDLGADEVYQADAQDRKGEAYRAEEEKRKAEEARRAEEERRRTAEEAHRAEEERRRAEEARRVEEERKRAEEARRAEEEIEKKLSEQSKPKFKRYSRYVTPAEIVPGMVIAWCGKKYLVDGKSRIARGKRLPCELVSVVDIEHKGSFDPEEINGVMRLSGTDVLQIPNGELVEVLNYTEFRLSVWGDNIVGDITDIDRMAALYLYYSDGYYYFMDLDTCGEFSLTEETVRDALKNVEEYSEVALLVYAGVPFWIEKG